MEDPPEAAVGPLIHIKEAYKSYGSVQALDGVDLSVHPGTIYGLLGPSGCGKTTLVSCIVGSCELDSGSILFDFKDLKDIGFMPQEISLHMILSIKEIMRFYGYVYRMKTDKISSRIALLSDMLELPPSNRCVSSLSGGQQRRVSLAVALLHDPKILILDEPTVGLDPVLSKNLWDRLREMSTQGKTIILTTHYIEEARQADMIGLMRKGRMLTQDSPRALLEKHNAEYLEDVFLALCYRENTSPRTVDASKRLSKEKIRTFDKPKKISFSRIKATLLKNFYVSKRNILMTIFSMILPIILVTCAKVAMGDPYHLPLAIVNMELEGSLQNCPRTFTNSCILENSTTLASCVFINELRDRTYLMTEYTDYEDALKEHRKNRNRGIVVFASNFTESLSERIYNGFKSGFNGNEIDYESSSIGVIIDNTEMQIRDQLRIDMLESFKNMISKTVEICTELVTPGALYPPVQSSLVKLQQPVYGPKNPNLFEDFQVGFNTMGILFCSMIFSAATILDEKTEGSLDRVLSAGVSMTEILIGHTVQHSISAVLYSIEGYILMYYALGHPVSGSPYLLLTVFILTAETGVFLGGAVGLLTEHLLAAVNAMSGFNFGFVCLTGLLWPIQGAHESIRPFLPYVPVTSTIETVRNITVKGYDLTSFLIIKGFAQIIFWMAMSLAFEILVIKTRKGAWNTKK